MIRPTKSVLGGAARWLASVALCMPMVACIDSQDPDDADDFGSVTQELGQTTLVAFPAGSGAGADLVVSGNYVYWTRQGVIARVNKTPGSPIGTLCSTCGNAYEFDVDSGAVYYTVPTTNTVASVPSAGGLPLFLANSPLPIVTEGNVTVDNFNVYWPTSTAIYRVGKTGGAVQPVVTGINPIAIAQDTNNLYVMGNSLLRRVSKSTLAVTNLAGATGIGLHVGAGVATWYDLGNAVRRVSTAGGAVTTYNTVAAGRQITSVAADATYIFYTEQPSTGSGGGGSATIRRIPIASPTAVPTILYTMPASLAPDDVASDGTYIYWADANGIKKADRI